MRKELSIKQIYDDFIDKVILSDIEKEVLNLYIRNNSIVKMSDELCLGTATISRIIADLKDKYNKYKKLELERLRILNDMN